MFVKPGAERRVSEESILMLLVPALSTMSPVVLPPKVSVWELVVARLPRPVRKVLLFPELAEIDAVGVPESTPVNANLAVEVALLPRRRSRVVASFGEIAPFATFQLEKDAVAEHVTRLDEVDKAPQFAKEESPKVIDELSSLTVPSASRLPSMYASSPSKAVVGVPFPTLREPVNTLTSPFAKDGSRVMFPVVAPPSVKVFPAVVWILLAAPASVRFPETVAAPPVSSTPSTNRSSSEVAVDGVALSPILT